MMRLSNWQIRLSDSQSFLNKKLEEEKKEEESQRSWLLSMTK
jgi:hypothetical protein